MSERPIILQGWQVRAALEDRLSLIIEPLKVQPERLPERFECDWRITQGQGVFNFTDEELRLHGAMFAPVAVGDRLIYQAASPAIFASNTAEWDQAATPEKALTVTGVEVRRVQDVTEDEAKLAGTRPAIAKPFYRYGLFQDWHHKPPLDWQSNPWCAYGRVEKVE